MISRPILQRPFLDVLAAVRDDDAREHFVGARPDAVRRGLARSPARMRLVRAAYSTHCSSSMAAFSSVVADLRAGRDENAIISAVSQSVLTRRGTPPV